MYLETTHAVGLPAGYTMQYSLTGASRMVPIRKPKPIVRTAEQLIAIKLRNDFLAKVAASKPKRQGLPPMPVSFRR